ncbi:MAG: SprB repeat-containing protein [Bacteroidia bacterium]|nr:SprB repeat-containing protein [Bacteroidia bacterium]
MKHTNTGFLSKVNLLLVSILIIGSQNYFCQILQAVSSVANASWTIKDPFEQKVFIENKGQFYNENIKESNSAHYIIDNAGTKIYFSSTGLTYEFKKYVKRKRDKKENKNEKHNDEYEEEREREKEEHNIAFENILVSMQWQNANPAAGLIAEEKVADYYTYADPKGRTAAILSNAYKKLIYKNLYPGVDVEYVFHETEGIKYSLVLHPGADASAIKMKYFSSEKIFSDAAGNIHIPTPVGDIIDHAPQTFYEKTRSPITSDFKLNRNIVEFNLAVYDDSQTVVIDPWVISPGFTGVNNAYDIDKDGAGNIYVSGGASPFYLKKFTPAGVLIWTFTCPANGGPYYGDHCVDNAGNAYLSYGSWRGSELTKVSPSGILLYSYLNVPIESSAELWRLTINCISGELIGGGIVFKTINPILCNINPANGTYSNFVTPYPNQTKTEVRSLTNDEAGNIYALTVDMTYPVPNSPGINNRIIKTTPAAGGLATLFNVSSGYTLNEGACGYALGTGPGGTYLDGFSGVNAIAVGCDLYTYNGLTLKRWNKNTGAQIGANVNVPGGVVIQGNLKNAGIVVDKCGNVYVGIVNGIAKYDDALNFISTVAMPSNVYDICLGNIPGEIIACGKGFISSVNMNVCTQFSVTKSSTPSLSCSPCNGTATIDLNGICNVSYLWAPTGQTGATATGLCPGNYTVTISSSCTPPQVETFAITGSPCGGPAVIATGSSICYGACATVTSSVSGGTGSYTYSWNTGATTKDINPCPTITTTYTVKVTDAGGTTATSTAVVTVNNINAQYTKGTANCSNCGCKEWIMVTGTGGTPPYNYQWPDGYDKRYKNSLCPGAYNVIVTDGNGCKATVKVNAP